MYWQTSRRHISLDRPLVMGILNVTPDSFSDGGSFVTVDGAVRCAGQMIADGADIIDIGGESTRPGSERISAEEEIGRVGPVISEIAKRFDTPISVDTSKSRVAAYAVDAGAEIINDISGLRFDPHIAHIAAESFAGVVLMHSRGTFETMHSQPPLADIFADVSGDFQRAIAATKAAGIKDECIALDIGIGFGKTFEQNLELLAKLAKIIDEFKPYPVLVGTSRKSFIGKILGDAPPLERLGGSLATALMAIQKGAKIVRVHDVKDTVAALSVLRQIERRSEIGGIVDES